MDVKKLIILVQERPILYDELLPEYPNYQLRLKAWQDVSKIMKQPADDCRKKWRSLRSLYNGYLRRKDKNPNPNWRYSEELSFLDKYLRRNRPSTATSFDFDANGKLNESSEDDSDEDETEEEVIENNKKTEFKSGPKLSYRPSKINESKVTTKTTSTSEKIFTNTGINAFESFPNSTSSFKEWFQTKPYQSLFETNDENDFNQKIQNMMTSKLNNLDSDYDENHADDDNQVETVKSVSIIERLALTTEDLKVFLLLLLSMIIMIVIILVWPKF